MKPTEKIWHNGKFIGWHDATIHVLSHVVSYGSSVFEGIRCYSTRNLPGVGTGPAVFRLREHAQRLVDSAKIYRMELPFSVDQLCDAMLELVAVNSLPSCYIRPIVLRGYGEIGVYPKNNPVEVYIAAWEWGKYLGQEAIENGVDVCVSSWNRSAPNTHPTLAKAGGNYLNSQLIKMEAKANGYAEGIALDVNGVVSEGSGENLFLVRHGKLFTPPLTSAVLPGITRDTVSKLARDLGYEVIESNLPRELLYLANEVFFTGTAAEITPIRSIDRIQIGAGKRGPITAELQREFFAIVEGDKEDRYGWLSPVPVAAAV
jgi:branched-chain amino acid aminotransferase